MVILDNSDRKNDYFALICRKMVVLQASGEKELSCKVLGKNVISEESVRNLFILHNSDRNLSNCKILAEWKFILRETDKMVILENSDRKNGYLASVWRKMVILQDYVGKGLSCKVLAKKMSFRENQGEIWLSCTIRKKIVLLQDSGRMNCYLARRWQKWLSWKTLTERRLSCNNLAKNGSFARFWWKKGYLAMFWQKNVISGESGRNLVVLHGSTENCSLARFWQNEWISCKTLTKMVTLEKSDRKNGYLALIWQKNGSFARF